VIIRSTAKDREAKALERAWDEFFEEGEKMRKINQAYKAACDLDAIEQHENADAVLLKAGVEPERVEQRRKHLNWVATNGGQK